MAKIMHPDCIERARKALSEILTKGYMYNHGYKMVRKDGSVIDVMINSSAIKDENNNFVRTICIINDITEQKKTEKKMAELMEEFENTNQELEKTNDELKDFAHIISHDLKAPLRGVSSIANWIESDYFDQIDDDGKEQIKLLQGRVERMHNLIEGVLQYSKVGCVKEEPVQIDLNELIAEIIDFVSVPENIIVTIDNRLPVIKCERTRILQIFENLLSNAVKYMDKPEGKIKIDCVDEEDFWKFSVADNGPGIEEVHFEKIFKIFQTLSPRDEIESTGVGLTVVKKIIELYGGRIWLESKLKEGSTFYFTFPKEERKGVVDEKLEANIVS